MALSAEMARDIENYLRGEAMPTAPTSVFFGLCSAGGVELSYTGYARQEVTANATNFGALDAPIDLQVAIPFGGPSSGGPHTQAVIGRFYKASTGSAYWYDGTLTTPRTPVNGQDFVVSIGALTLTVDPAA